MFSSLISVCFFSSSYFFFFFLSRRRNLMYQNLCNRFPYLSWCVALAHVFGYYRLYKFNHTRYFELMSQNFRCSGVSYKISKKERVLPRQGHAARGVFRHCKWTVITIIIIITILMINTVIKSHTLTLHTSPQSFTR